MRIGTIVLLVVLGIALVAVLRISWVLAVAPLAQDLSKQLFCELIAMRIRLHPFVRRIFGDAK